MASASDHRPLPPRGAIVATVIAGMILLAVVASAASLGGIAVGSLFAQETPVTIPIPVPPPLVATDFSGCQGSLDGWVDESGAAWASQSGDWQCLGNDVVRSQQRSPLAHATVAVPINTGIRIGASMERISAQANRSGPGLALFADGSGELIYVMYERDQARVSIGLRSPLYGDVVLDRIVGIADRDTAEIAVLLDGLAMTITLDGVVIGMYDLATLLTLAQQIDLLSNSRFGLLSDNDNFSRFDGFRIDLS